MGNNEIWIYVEHHNNIVHPVTHQLITKANEIKNNKKVVAILLEDNKQELEKDLVKYGPDEIIIFKNKRVKNAPDSLIAKLITQLTNNSMPNAMLFGATVLGRSISARLQAQLLTGLTADCMDLSYEDDLLIQIKPSYGDNIMCEIICPNHFPQMATVRPNIFTAKEVDKKDVKITIVNDLVIEDNQKITVLNEKALLSKSDSIGNAQRVIALGRGMKFEKNSEIISNLANRLGAKVGVTRPLTDLSNFTNEDQIGQSGSSVRPKLLLTLGVHGAVQFVSGIKEAEIIVSVNNNSNAPIFDYADYKYVGDAKEFVEALLNVIE